MNDTISQALRMASVAETRAALDAGSISASALTQAYLNAIDAENPKLNAYIHVLHDSALKAAQQSDQRRAQHRTLGPLDGIPLAIKNNIDIAGVATTAGMATRRERIATEDAVVIARLRAAGAVILGTLNMHEAALGATTDNLHYGRCHNPWRHDYTAGGSSGGSAAAVAAGLCTAALGTDTMGSVRIPASYCGVAALKPASGCISLRGVVPVSKRLDSVGVIGRKVGDLLPLLDVLAGYDALDIASNAEASDTTSRSGRTDPKKLRFGCVANLDVCEVGRDIAARFMAALDALNLNPTTVSFSDYDFGKVRRAGLLVCESEMLIAHFADWSDHRELFSGELKRLLTWAESKRAIDLARADLNVDQAVIKMRLVFERVDVLLTPTTPQTAFAFDAGVPANQADLTSVANLAGLCAVSVPMGTLAGLPIGFQLLAPAGRERQLLALAERFELRLASLR
jgi:Asp-tRNA(Asn)/Glu-tRNA(Gln) amidotransferase A subunit family amidase